MRLLIFTLSIIFSIGAFAGEKGNGGYSIVCRDQSGKIISAELLDIFEGKTRLNKEYTRYNLRSDIAIKLISLKLKHHPKFQRRFLAELEHTRHSTTFVSGDAKLENSEDVFPVFGNQECNYEQVANYSDRGHLKINAEIFNAFDDLNKTALLVHEAFYFIYREHRKNIAKLNSNASRKLTALLMADDADKEEIDRLIKLHGH